MSFKTLAFSFLVLSFQALSANDSMYLIQEMTSLRDSLKIEDPARVDLTLRLADLYFDVSIQEGNQAGKTEDLDVLKKNRLKALELYKHSLNGTDKLTPAVGLNRIKVQFQMARLLSRLNEGKMAEPYYKEILANKESPKKMIEQSALALAEWYEEDAHMAESKKYYDLAISLCDDKNSCNYAYYRLGWLLYKDTKLDEAIIAMEKSLWIDESVIRENSLTDLLLFISNKETNGLKEYEKMAEIAKKSKRPELTRLLTEAFYVAGNRLAGSNLLAELNKVDPNLYYEVRLLEEFYGFRKWDKVEEYLTILEKRSVKDIPVKVEEAKEVLTILRRFIVQVDAEMQVVKNLNIFLKRSIDIYLDMYPNDELRKKMQAGWLSAEDDSLKKLSKLERYINEDLSFGVDQKEIRKLRQTRLSLAQAQKRQDIVLDESRAIAEILKGTNEADEFLYVAARELYSQKNYVEALPYFQSIIKNTEIQKVVNNWAVLSQNLILDIFNNQKNYDGIISQVTMWKDLTSKLQVSEEVTKETKSMDQIYLQAQFEKAATMKESPEALLRFYNFCMSDQFSEKSCPNAKVLSIKFKDQGKLIKLLEKLKDENALVVEYELMGLYSNAAQLKEKLELNGKKKPNLEDYLKISFLYELDNKRIESQRVLTLMMSAIKREKSIPVDLEKSIFSALDEANLLDEKALSMPWSINQKLKLASRLEIIKPSEATKKILLSQKDGSGPVWSKLILSQLEQEFLKANKIKFYGNQSQKLFKQRSVAIEKFVSLAKPVLDGSDLETRVYILHMLKLTYKNIANEILNTPIPDGLDDETLATVTGQISTLADPFDRVNEDYDKLLSEQLAAITDIGLREQVTKNITGDVKNYSNFIELKETANVNKSDSLSAFDLSQLEEMRQKLLSDPEDRTSLIGLKDFYAKNEKTRLAAYYTARVENLENSKEAQ